MNIDNQYQYGCSDEYAELCALSTSGELSSQEMADLSSHVAGCAPCAALLREYNALISAGLTRLAPELELGIQSIDSDRELRAERRLNASLQGPRFITEHPELPSSSSSSVTITNWQRGSRIAFPLSIAAALLISIGGAYEVGRKSAVRLPSTTQLVATTQPITPVAPSVDLADLQRRLADAQQSLKETEVQSSAADKRLADLIAERTSLLAQIDDLTKKGKSASDSLLASAQQRDVLQQQLNDAATSLEQVKEDLNRARQDRQGAVLRVASLENEVNTLHATMAVADKSASTNEQFLAQDRDIRELMGARQLYIADVLDVQSDGQRSKPFGRVFYTKGKRLVFYAFDLESQPGYHEAKTFQAWGKPDSSSDKPVSLGIFYMDNEKNKRWVLKSDNPNVLAQINAVFVTVEPQGGSPKPTGKPFLEAYLHTLPPNHP